MEAEFTRLAGLLEADAAKREQIGKEVKEINRIFRSIQFTLHSVHNVCNNAEEITKICAAARAQFSELAPIWSRIYIIIGGESVEKYRAHWRFATEQLVFLAAFTYWLETHQLISIDQTVQMIGVGTNQIYAVSSVPFIPPSSTSTILVTVAPTPAAPSTSTTGVGLDIEDYLQGCTAIPQELTRLCVNAVRTGNYELPQQIATFVSDLYSGFRLLNLKNDALRRKFDSIKYSVSKLEEILYDLTVRGLGKKDGPLDEKSSLAAGSPGTDGSGDVTMQP